jgi:hypothetical protein
MTDISGTILVPILRNVKLGIKMFHGTSIIFNHLTQLVDNELGNCIDTEYGLDGRDSIPDNGGEHLSSPFGSRAPRPFFLLKGHTKQTTQNNAI